MTKIELLKGMSDLFESELSPMRAVEALFRDTCLARGYGEVRTPMLEQNDLFARGLGDASTVVGKEMYTFPDKKGLLLSLRPEGTAAVVRAYVGAGLRQREPSTRLFYMGPMFRYERPQKGRQRQFHQFGLELFGLESASADCEVIALIEAYWKALGLSGKTTLLLNSIGCTTCRPLYLEKLVAKLDQGQDILCSDCQTRRIKNPLRVFDCKHERCRDFCAELPHIADHLCEACAAHWGEVRRGLDALDIAYTLDPALVRGLDYYTRTAFEWRAQGLGSQDAIGGGGRYDGLVELLDGPPTPAIGVAIGVERLMIALEAAAIKPSGPSSPIAILPLDPASQISALALQSRLLAEMARPVIVNLSGASLKAQLRQANRDGAAYALILGETERIKQTVMVKNLQSSEQVEMSLDKLELLFKVGAGSKPAQRTL